MLPTKRRKCRPHGRSHDRRLRPARGRDRGDGSAGFHVTHAYGLTETYGPAMICAWHDEWTRCRWPSGRS